MKKKNSCRVNCTFGLAHCTHLNAGDRCQWQSLYTAGLISLSWWNPQSSGFLFKQENGHCFRSMLIHFVRSNRIMNIGRQTPLQL